MPVVVQSVQTAAARCGFTTSPCRLCRELLGLGPQRGNEHLVIIFSTAEQVAVCIAIVAVNGRPAKVQPVSDLIGQVVLNYEVSQRQSSP